MHPESGVVSERARESVEARLQTQVDDLPLPGKGLREAVDGRAADALEREVVLVLAEVGELDPHGAWRHANTREAVVKLDGDDLHPAERSGGLRRKRTGEGKAYEQKRQPSHRSSGTRAKEAACGTIGAASVPSHCSSTEQ